jgi:hypothetical protein
MNMASADETLAQIVTSASVSTIDEVIAVMRGIDAALPNNDGLKWFNLLYLRVSEAVKSAPPSTSWEDLRWLSRLDVVFAGFYFEAVANWHRDPNTVTRAWLPLFTARHRQGIQRVQFALAGMNAHINHDLPQALVQTDVQLVMVPQRASPEYRDYERVNSILEDVEAQVKDLLATGIVGEIAQALGSIGDVIAMWDVRTARDTAWSNAEILWHLQGFPVFRDAFLQNLDRLVGLSSKGLLVSAG